LDGSLNDEGGALTGASLELILHDVFVMQHHTTVPDGRLLREL
jgi:hypothetical protein